MISVVLYGRNDSHGYNLHKRAAISLNCIAEVLSHPHDEILFVDYNTPNELPTFIEAIYDTLTARARRLLRVVRVRPATHERLYGQRTHLVALEPVARNIAVRRSNPANRWILSTNTDMVFVPRPGVTDLTEAVAGLSDGHYILPRFDLPEPLWESWTRTDPVGVIRACDELGSALHLNDITVTYPYMRFDSPGDFQLIPRRTLFEVFGFDERMIHGWHVDANMCKRLARIFGSTESLADRLKGYHCDHTMVTTLVHRLDLKLENDPAEFVWEVDDPYARHQETSWGLPDETFEEVDFVDGAHARFASAVQKTLERPQAADYQSNAIEVRNYIAYHSEHVLPYLAGNLAGYPRSARILYVGANPRMLELLATCVFHLGFTRPVHYVADVLNGLFADVGVARALPLRRSTTAEESSWPRALVTGREVLIFDFGLDAADAPSPTTRVTDWPRASRYRLGVVARYLQACADACNELFVAEPQGAPDFFVLNANPSIFSQVASQFLFTMQTPYNTQVRKGRPRLGRDRLYRSHRWKYTEDALRSTFGYDAPDEEPARLDPGQSIDLTSTACSSGYKDGHWGGMDFLGTWTDGHRADLLLPFDPATTTDLLAEVETTEAFVGPLCGQIRVRVRFEGEPLARWVFGARYGTYAPTLLLPQRLIAGKGTCRLTVEIENPQSTARVAEVTGEGGMIGEDPRELGVKIQRVTIHGIERARYRLGSRADFTAGGNGARLMEGCWTTPDIYGAWTLGPEAGLVLNLEDTPEGPVWAVFTISDAAVSDAALDAEFPSLEVDVLFNGEKVDRWVLMRGTHDRKLVVGPEVLNRQRPVRISFQISTPRTPAELKWSDDTRPLGFRLTRFRMSPVEFPPYRFGQVIDFTETGNAEDFLGANWTYPDRLGRWTEGQEATLTLRLDQGSAAPLPASFFISDCVVSEHSPYLPVQVAVNGIQIGEWSVGPDRKPHVRTLEIAPEHLVKDRALQIAFRVPQPRSPASLGWSGDQRPLGIRLTRVCVGTETLSSRMPRPTWRAALRDALGWMSPEAVRVLRRLRSLRARPARSNLQQDAA